MDNIQSNLVKIGETLDDLQIKGIKIIQKNNGFRFGMDAVLLANFAKVKKFNRVIDLCSGTGIIPFILAGKTQAKEIMGLEIQEDMVEMANRSIIYNNLKDKINIIKQDIKGIKELKTMEKFDVVTVNPPYKLINSGLLSEDEKSAIARHEICCTLEDVIIASNVLLKDKGKIYMVHRPNRIADIFCVMRKYKIEPKVIRMVQPNKNKTPNLLLIEAQKNGGVFLKWEPTLYVYNDKGEYTEEVKKIYGLE